MTSSLKFASAVKLNSVMRKDVPPTIDTDCGWTAKVAFGSTAVWCVGRFPHLKSVVTGVFMFGEATEIGMFPYGMLGVTAVKIVVEESEKNSWSGETVRLSNLISKSSNEASFRE